MTETRNMVFYYGKTYDRNSDDDMMRLFNDFLDVNNSREEFYRVFEDMMGETPDTYYEDSHYLDNLVNAINWSEAEGEYDYDGGTSLSTLHDRWYQAIESAYSGPIMTPAKGYGGARNSEFIAMKISEM